MTAASIVVAVTLSLSPYSTQLSRDVAIAKAETILQHLRDGKTADIVKEFDARMTQDLAEDRLKTAWPGVVQKFGAFKGVTERREGQVEGRQAVELILAFEKETIVQRVVFDKDGKVSGLVFRPLSLAALPAGK